MKFLRKIGVIQTPVSNFDARFARFMIATASKADCAARRWSDSQKIRPAVRTHAYGVRAIDVSVKRDS
ncbi:hypothetical protein AT302_02135 [Pandoraea norimbergensis]|uniref:Uncharacterized protein n=1 Tax=Pandoraea norimbergensis TaxID=93219 RepID=A0ABN4JDE5_9BURK|nr:hypothetical protein AT302_02135 [Pandoraea norimbergensis]